MPHKSWAVGEEVLAADFNTYLADQVIPTFANSGALTSAWPNAPIGARAITTDTFTTYTHRAAGAAGWQPDMVSGFAAYNFVSGAVNIPHTLGRVPTMISLLVGQSVGAFIAYAGVTTTTINARAWTAAGAAYAGNLNVQWTVA